MTEQTTDHPDMPLGIIWVICPYPVVSAGLERILEGEARVYVGPEPPEEDAISSVVFCAGGVEGISEGIRRIRRANPKALVLAFGLHLDLALARAALRSGARGYTHAGMSAQQIIRAFKMAYEGEIVAPRSLLQYLINNEELADVDMLSDRQREILNLVDEGMSNAQIAKRLYLSESTVKQHLRGAYKVLGVSNRTEAVRLIRNDD